MYYITIPGDSPRNTPFSPLPTPNNRDNQILIIGLQQIQKECRASFEGSIDSSNAIIRLFKELKIHPISSSDITSTSYMNEINTLILEMLKNQEEGNVYNAPEQLESVVKNALTILNPPESPRKRSISSPYPIGISLVTKNNYPIYKDITLMEKPYPFVEEGVNLSSFLDDETIIP